MSDYESDMDKEEAEYNNEQSRESRMLKYFEEQSKVQYDDEELKEEAFDEERYEIYLINREINAEKMYRKQFRQVKRRMPKLIFHGREDEEKGTMCYLYYPSQLFDCYRRYLELKFNEKWPENCPIFVKLSPEFVAYIIDLCPVKQQWINGMIYVSRYRHYMYTKFNVSVTQERILLKNPSPELLIHMNNQKVPGRFVPPVPEDNKLNKKGKR